MSFLCPLNNFPLCSIFRNPIVGAKNGRQKASPLELSTLHILIGTKNLNLGCHFLKQSWDPLTHPLTLEVAPHSPLLDSSRPNPNWCRHFLQSVGGPKKKEVLWSLYLSFKSASKQSRTLYRESVSRGGQTHKNWASVTRRDKKTDSWR